MLPGPFLRARDRGDPDFGFHGAGGQLPVERFPGRQQRRSPRGVYVDGLCYAFTSLSCEVVGPQLLSKARVPL